MLSTQMRFAANPALSVRRVSVRKAKCPVAARTVKLIVKSSQEQLDQKSFSERLALPAAALLGAALLFAATPDEALAARSGGRVGGSGGFAAKRR